MLNSGHDETITNLLQKLYSQFPEYQLLDQGNFSMKEELEICGWSKEQIELLLTNPELFAKNNEINKSGRKFSDPEISIIGFTNELTPEEKARILELL